MQNQERKASIVVKNLQKTYEGKVPTPVLKGVYLMVHEGEYVAIMGRSGSGKSTLLNQLCLLDQPNKGEILIDNVDVTKLSERKKTQYRLEHFGYVFQEYALLPEFTALETVAMPLMLLHKPKKVYNKAAKEMLAAVGLEHRMHHYPSELSGGEQQRVAIARAIANNPRILFADEPCANLDSESSEEIINIFKRFNKEFKQTIEMITHEPEDRKHVERVIWIKDGVATSE